MSQAVTFVLLLNFLSIMSKKGVSANCPDEFFGYHIGSGTYCLHHVMWTMQWDEAEAHCQSLGGGLFSPTTKQEMDLVLNFLRNPFIKTGTHKEREIATYFVHWLGADNDNENLEWMMYVQDTEDADSFLEVELSRIPTYWDDDEPSITYYRGCLTMVAGQRGSAVKGTYKYRWRANDCTESRHSICLIRKQNEIKIGDY